MSTTPRLPIVARILLGVLCPRDTRESVEGDLLELAARRSIAGGGQSARSRLWRDVLSLCWLSTVRRVHGVRRLVVDVFSGRATAGIGQDVRYAARLMRRQPGFSVAVIATLAVGIGANAAIFSVVNAVLFRDLPYEGGDRFVAVRRVISWTSGSFTAGFSSRDYLRLQAQQRALERIAAVTFNETTLTGHGEPENLQTGFVSSGFFPLLGVRPQIGREFMPGEYEVGQNGVAIISHALWRRRFAADPAVTSQSIALGGRLVQIVGVLPADFRFVDPADVWVPLVFTPARLSNSGWIDLDVYGRMKTGGDQDAASRSLTALVVALDENPDNDQVVRVERVRTLMARDVRSSLQLFWGAVGLVLLIACANVANLLLARAADRRREIAVRRALGIGGARLARQLLIESLLLSLSGGAAGLAVTYWVVTALVGISPASIPRLNEIGLDPAVVGFTLGLSLLTGLVFGVAPALQATRLDLTAVLRDGGVVSRAGFRLRRIPARSAILVAEIAVTLVLLVGSGLLVRSFLRLQQVDTGFSADNVAAVTVSIPIRRARDRVEALAFFEQLTERIGHLAGVSSAGATSGLPLTTKGGRTSLLIEGKPFVAAPPRDDPASGAPLMPPPPPPPKGQKQPIVTPFADAIYSEVSAGYIETMGIQVRAGRAFTRDDRATSLPVVVISEAMAKRYWPGEDPLGRRLQVEDGRWKTIVGIVHDVRRFRLEAAEAIPEIYLPIAQALPDDGEIPEHNVEASDMTVVARGRDASALLPAMRAQVYALNPNQPVSDALTIDQLLATVQAPRRFNMIVLTAFGSAGALLTSIGLYGVMAYLVSQRRREIGIRLALGARGRHILELVAGEGFALVSIGVVLGLGATFAATRLIRGLLFGVPPDDPLTIGSVVLLLLVVSGAAVLIPTRRAQSVDPVTVLRQE